MSVSQELRLIEAVSRHPELLRPDRSTTSTQARAVKWPEVSTEVGISGKHLAQSSRGEGTLFDLSALLLDVRVELGSVLPSSVDHLLPSF